MVLKIEIQQEKIPLCAYAYLQEGKCSFSVIILVHLVILPESATQMGFMNGLYCQNAIHRSATIWSVLLIY